MAIIATNYSRGGGGGLNRIQENTPPSNPSPISPANLVKG